MTKNIYGLLIVLVFIVCSKADEITIVADKWYPYNGMPNSSKPGYGIEIVQKIFESKGHTVKYKLLPWSRAIKETQKGNYTAVIGAYKEEVPDFIFPSEEFGDSENVFFTNEDSTWYYTGLDSLKEIRVGLIKHYSYGSKMNRYFNQNPLQVQYSFGEEALQINIRKLLNKRVDAILEDRNVLLATIKNIDNQFVFRNAGSTGYSNKIYVAFSPSPKIKNAHAYAKLFSQGIKELKASGELDNILKKYGVPYWK